MMLQMPDNTSVLLNPSRLVILILGTSSNAYINDKNA